MPRDRPGSVATTEARAGLGLRRGFRLGFGRWSRDCLLRGFFLRLRSPRLNVGLRRDGFRLAVLLVSGRDFGDGGDAVVHVRAADGGSAEYELHTGDQARAAAAHAGFRIALERLEPYPFSSRVIQPEEYRATLTVSR